MNEALVLIGPGPAPGETAIGASRGAPFRVMDQEVHASIDGAPIHPSPCHSKGDSRRQTHLYIFRALCFTALCCQLLRSDPDS